MKYVEEFHIAIKHDKKAWMVENGTKKQQIAAKSRADKWALVGSTGQHPGKSISIKNTPISGFKFVGFVSRYSTSNKFFEIEDPRGFVIEINCGNVSKILESCIIDKGEILGDLVYLKDGGATHLVVAGSKEHTEAMEIKEVTDKDYIPVSKLIPGDIVEDKNGKEYQYLGQYRTTWNLKVTERQQVTFGRALNNVDQEVLNTDVTCQWVDMFRNTKSKYSWDIVAQTVKVVKVVRNDPIALLTEKEHEQVFRGPSGRAYELLRKARNGLYRASSDSKLLSVEHRIPTRRTKKEKKDAEATDE